MAPAHNHREQNDRNHMHNRVHASIRYMQINLQQCRTPTDNIQNLSDQFKSDILFIEESNLYKRKIAGISTKTESAPPTKTKAGPT